MNKTKFQNIFSNKCGISVREGKVFVDAINNLLLSTLEEGDTIAIPGFGNIFTKVIPEHIDISEEGVQVLRSPKIHAEFTPATSFVNKLKNS